MLAARACIPEGATDTDPQPTTRFLGDLKLTPDRVALTASSRDFQIQLSASSQELVRYRVQVIGPHLSVAQPRGELTGSTTIPIHVDASKLTGHDVAGTVKVFTSLGNAVLDAPIHVGLTGSYAGALRYDGGPVDLGDARISLDFIEENGSIRARVDSRSSLLFPATAAGETTGHGSYTLSDGVDVTLAQRIDEPFGGERNHFRRPIGRKIRLRLVPTAEGDLDGTFEESVIGLFSSTITTTGQ